MVKVADKRNNIPLVSHGQQTEFFLLVQTLSLHLLYITWLPPLFPSQPVTQLLNLTMGHNQLLSTTYNMGVGCYWANKRVWHRSSVLTWTQCDQSSSKSKRHSSLICLELYYFSCLSCRSQNKNSAVTSVVLLNRQSATSVLRSSETRGPVETCSGSSADIGTAGALLVVPFNH